MMIVMMMTMMIIIMPLDVCRRTSILMLSCVISVSEVT